MVCGKGVNATTSCVDCYMVTSYNISRQYVVIYVREVSNSFEGGMLRIH